MKRRVAISIIAAGLLFGLAGAVAAQTQADLNGTWKLNADKSKFASSDAPENVIVRFESDGRTLHETLTTVHSDVQTTTSLNYSLDGKEVLNHVGDEEIKTTAKWDGGALVLQWKDQGGTSTRRFVLAKDGKSMTMEVRDSDQSIPSGDVVTLEKK